MAANSTREVTVTAPTTIRLSPYVEAEMLRRTEPTKRGMSNGLNRNRVINRDLERYYSLVSATRVGLNVIAQWKLDILHDAITAAVASGHLSSLMMIVADYLSKNVPPETITRDMLQTFMGELMTMGDLDRLALLDAVEAWNVTTHADDEPFRPYLLA
jgi:hypothetical protein